MEFWEGAILVVGGLWLVGRMSRQNANHPVNSVPLALAGGTGRGLNPTTSTNLAGSSTLIAGEPFNPGGVPSFLGMPGASCCGGGAGAAGTGAGGGGQVSPTLGASTGAPRLPAIVTKLGILPKQPVPVRQVPVTQAPVRSTALSPAATMPRQPVRFYAL